MKKVITDLNNLRTFFVDNSFMWEISTHYEILDIISMCYLLVYKCILSYNQATRVKHKLSCDIFLLVYHLGAVLDRLRVSWKALHFRIGNGLFGYLLENIYQQVFAKVNRPSTVQLHTDKTNDQVKNVPS